MKPKKTPNQQQLNNDNNDLMGVELFTFCLNWSIAKLLLQTATFPNLFRAQLFYIFRVEILARTRLCCLCYVQKFCLDKRLSNLPFYPSRPRVPVRATTARCGSASRQPASSSRSTSTATVPTPSTPRMPSSSGRGPRPSTPSCSAEELEQVRGSRYFSTQLF